jgi:hypothetical protein
MVKNSEFFFILLTFHPGNSKSPGNVLNIQDPDAGKKDYSGFLNARNPRIPSAQSVVSGSNGDFCAGVTGKRAADTELVVPALTRAFVE